MIENLKRDYLAMTGMIFGKAPDFISVIDTVSKIEIEINEKF